MLRALALYNIFPSTYDMAILKDLTTTTFKEKSVVYLHGQHHGLWLLNTVDEMDKVKATIPRIFDGIKNKRPWVFIGYSGSDPIFNHIKNLGRFDNGLYWVGYNNHLPDIAVQEFLNTPNTNAFFVKGYDADAFMLKLNQALDLEQPQILDKPFSALKEMVNGIIDINDEWHFQGVKKRLKITNKYVDESINQFEKGEKPSISENEVKVDILNNRIIDLVIAEMYDEGKIIEIETKINALNIDGLVSLLPYLFINWGNYLANLAKVNTGNAENLYSKAFEKYNRAITLEPDLYEAFNNWGNALGNLAHSKKEKASEELYKQANEKFEKAIVINPNNYVAFYNWGSLLVNLAKINEGKASEELYYQAFEKFEKAILIKPDYHEAFNNWGIGLSNLAKSKEAQELYHRAIEKFKKAILIKPDCHEAFNNWGLSLMNLAESNKTEELYHKAIEKFEKAISIKPDYHEAFNNWGLSLINLAKSKEGKAAKNLYYQAMEKFEISIKYGGKHYNLACLHAVQKNKEEALRLLKTSLSKNETTIDFALEDESWKPYLEDEDFKKIIKQYRK